MDDNGTRGRTDAGHIASQTDRASEQNNGAVWMRLRAKRPGSSEGKRSAGGGGRSGWWRAECARPARPHHGNAGGLAERALNCAMACAPASILFAATIAVRWPSPGRYVSSSALRHRSAYEKDKNMNISLSMVQWWEEGCREEQWGFDCFGVQETERPE